MIEAPVTISVRAVPRMTPATISGNMTGLFSMAGDMIAEDGGDLSVDPTITITERTTTSVSFSWDGANGVNPPFTYEIFTGEFEEDITQKKSADTPDDSISETTYTIENLGPDDFVAFSVRVVDTLDNEEDYEIKETTTLGQVTSVDISPQSPTIEPNGTVVLTASVSSSELTSDEAQWVLTGNEDLSFEETGFNEITITGVDAVVDSTATVRAEAVEDTDVFDEVTLTVVEVTEFPNTREDDEAALEALYSSAGGANWDDNTGWAASGMSLADDIYGVGVDTIGGELRVTYVKLNGGGQNPADDGVDGGNGLDGTLPSALGNLQQCWYFNVKNNDLSGSVPWDAFSSMNPIHLYLNGRIYDVVNKTSSTIGDTDASRGSRQHPGKETNTTERSNRFGGDWDGAFTGYTNLKFFECTGGGLESDARIEGAIGSGIGDCDLEVFFVNWQGVTSIHSSIANSTDMVHIGFENQFGGLDNLEEGELDFLTAYTNLQYLWVEDNEYWIDFPDLSLSTQLWILAGKGCRWTGPFPGYVIDGTMEIINQIELSFARWDTTSLPESNLDDTLSLCNISGSSSLPSSQRISGAFPSTLLTSNDGIKVTNFSWQNFSGSIQEDLTMMRNLRNLRFADNILEGAWPELNWLSPIGDLEDLNAAWFNENKYVPDDFLMVDDGRESSDSGPIVQKTRLEWYQHFCENSMLFGDQKRFGSEQDALTGSIIDFSYKLSHADNSYQWEKDGDPVNDETTTSIDTATYGTGVYELVLTNSNVAGETYRSIQITIE